MSVRNPFRSREKEIIDSATGILTPTISNVRDNTFIIAAHLAYPLLEGLGRRMASMYVEVDGTVKTLVARCLGEDGEDLFIKTNKLSSIAMLLRLIETKVADSQLKEDLKSFREHSQAIFRISSDSKSVYDVIYDLRNTLLHGQRQWQIFYGTLVNLIYLLINSGIDKHCYDSNYEELVKHINFDSRTRLTSGHGFCYYPRL